MKDIYGFTGLSALITGASSGIGLAVAEALAEHGASVALHYNSNGNNAIALVERLTSEGKTAVVVQGDLSQDDEASRVVSEAAEALGGIDILINNAGAMGSRSPFAEAGGALGANVFDVNCRSLLQVTHKALPWLEKSSSAAIVNTGSIAGWNGGGPGAGFYAAAKGYVHTITRGMAKEFAAAGIRVNAIAPGVIITPFHESTPPEILASFKAAIPMGRLGEPADCIGPYLFLCSSKQSGYVTGQILDVNGGQYMP